MWNAFLGLCLRNNNRAATVDLKNSKMHPTNKIESSVFIISSEEVSPKCLTRDESNFRQFLAKY